MNLRNLEKVLVISPHTDDAELGMGGTIALLVERDVEVYCHAFSNASKSLPKNLPKDTLEVEFRNAMKALKLPDKFVKIHNYEVRTFSYHRQQILDDLYKIKIELKPDLVFLPSTKDIHQDHQVICQEGIRIFKTTCLLGYELPWNNITFPTTSFFVLKKDHIDKKIDALKCYNSQKYREYLNPEFIQSLAITRGTQIQVDFAEAFEVIRWVWQ